MKFSQYIPEIQRLLEKAHPEWLGRILGGEETTPKTNSQVTGAPPVRKKAAAEKRKMPTASAIPVASDLRLLPLKDRRKQPFGFSIPRSVEVLLERIDFASGSALNVPEPISNKQTRGHHLAHARIEEAVASSWLDGATTLREAAAEMIRTGREPSDGSERMVLNAWLGLNRISERKEQEDFLSPGRILELHRIVIGGAGSASPNPASGADMARLSALCHFANGEPAMPAISPIVRAVVVHFWVLHARPFSEGNSRMARFLCRATLLRHGYWIAEFASLSAILARTPAAYARSLLDAEKSGNDLTPFLLAQADALDRAVARFHAYVVKKSDEAELLGSQIPALDRLNPRQRELVLHALKHPRQHYTVESHQQDHGVVYETSRLDLMGLLAQGLLERKKSGKTMLFHVPENLEDRLWLLSERRG